MTQQASAPALRTAALDPVASGAEQPALTKPERRRVPSLRQLALLLVLAASGLGYYGYQQHLQSQPYQWSGTVEARAITVGSRLGGRVQRVLAAEGELLQPLQPIVTLEPGDLHARLAQAQAQVAELEANLEKVRKGPRAEELEQAEARARSARAALEQARAGARPEQIAASRARLAAREVAVEKARLDAERMATLGAAGAVKRSEVEDAALALETAQAQADAERQQLQELLNGTRAEELAQARARQLEQAASARLLAAGSRAEDIQVAEAQLAGARARVQQVQALIDELTIRAPLASRVETLELRPGDLLAPDAPAAELVEPDALYVRLYVPETLLGHVSVGQDVEIVVDSFPERAFAGTIEHMNSVGEFSPRNLQTADERANQVFACRVRVSEGLELLRAGMSALIRVAR